LHSHLLKLFFTTKQEHYEKNFGLEYVAEDEQTKRKCSSVRRNLCWGRNKMAATKSPKKTRLVKAAAKMNTFCNFVLER
jgi:hypothetical protein